MYASRLVESCVALLNVSSLIEVSHRMIQSLNAVFLESVLYVESFMAVNTALRVENTFVFELEYSNTLKTQV